MSFSYRADSYSQKPADAPPSLIKRLKNWIREEIVDDDPWDAETVVHKLLQSQSFDQSSEGETSSQRTSHLS